MAELKEKEQKYKKKNSIIKASVGIKKIYFK